MHKKNTSNNTQNTAMDKIIIVAAALGTLSWLAFHVFGPSGRQERNLRSVQVMDRQHAAMAYEEVRRRLITYFRNPYGKTPKHQVDYLLEYAVACLDRLDAIDGREAGPVNRAKIRRVLEVRLRTEAEYWIQGDCALDGIGKEQEPSIFANGTELGPFPR